MSLFICNNIITYVKIVKDNIFKIQQNNVNCYSSVKNLNYLLQNNRDID